MARFYGSIQGSGKTEATRMGTANTGIHAHVRGWDAGVKVRCFVNDVGADVCEVYSTGGSNNPSGDKLLATVREHDISQEHLF